jgi:hypothetical protein
VAFILLKLEELCFQQLFLPFEVVCVSKPVSVLHSQKPSTVSPDILEELHMLSSLVGREDKPASAKISAKAN